MSLKKFTSAIAIIGLMLFLVMASTNSVRAQSYPLDSMWVSPSTVSYSTDNASVGTLFNLTVWANMENGTYDWQVTMNFDASVFQEVACGYTAGTTSEYFAGHTIVGPSPVVDNVLGSIEFGESLLGISDYVPEENASLMYAEFNITSMPNAANPTPITGIFDINATGLAGTFFDDVNGNTIISAANLYDASFTLSYAPAPTINSVTQVPDVNSVNDSEAVVVSANVTDNSGAGIANATIIYETAVNWITNYTAPMTLNATTGLYDGTIPGYIGGTVVTYVVDVYDNNGGFTESSPYQNTVIPEYAVLSLLFIMIAMLAVAITIARKKHGK
ncbi:MAG: hypothetical protein ABSB89_09325 [Candidatus Bathyarchaeia archaeon]|jgi:hypothetical protein